MARKKTVSVEPEISDPGMEETPQYPEGEVPVEDSQDAALASGEEPFDGELPPDGDAFAFPEGAPPFEERDPDGSPEAAAADPASGGVSSEPEGPAPEDGGYNKDKTPIRYDGGVLSVKTNGGEYRSSLELESVSQAVCGFNAVYILNGLNQFKAKKVKSVTMRLDRPVAPIVLTDDGGDIAMVLPVRLKKSA